MPDYKQIKQIKMDKEKTIYCGGGKKMGSETSFNAFIRSHYLPGQVTNLIIERHGKTKSVPLEFKPYPQIILKLLPHAPAKSQFLLRKWLDSKTSK